jgi:hypothetical protein
MTMLPAFPPQLLRGVRNLLIEYGGVKKGDDVVILSELGTYVDPTVVMAQAAVLDGIGAHAHLLWTPILENTWWEDLSPIVRGAVGNADVVVQNIRSIGKTHLLDLMLQKKVRRLRNYASDLEVMTSDWAAWPIEIQDVIEQKVNTKLAETKTFRVTTADGSDLQGEVAKRIAAWRPTVRRGGINVSFPPGVFRASESENARGVLVVHSTYPWGARRVGLPEIRFNDPVRLTVEGNFVTHFEGGAETEKYRALFEAHEATLGRNAYKMDSFHCGSNPRAFTAFAPQSDPDRFDHLIHEHESWFHFHIGSLSDKATDRTQKAEHVNAVLHEPTVYLDGEKVWDQGRLTIWSDPEVRACARSLGHDPDVLFAQRPIWWG